MIFEGSRYANDPVLRVTLSDGTVSSAIYADPNAEVRRFQFDYYTAKDGDRYDLLAGRAYGDPELWWAIARANPEVFYPDNIPFGTILRIPRAQYVL